MADGGLTLQIDETLAEELRAVAAARGISVEALALERLSAASEPGFEENSPDWAEDHARLAEYRRTGEAYSAEDVMQEFQDRIAERLRANRT